jgi:hypothetical protein
MTSAIKLFREIITACSGNEMQPIHKICGENADIYNLQQLVYIALNML